MKKLLLLSIIVGPILIAARTARSNDPKRGFRKFLKHLVLFNLAYGVMLAVIWGRL